jgi:para-aminobenzoate synthetase component I
MPLTRTQISWRDPVAAFAPLKDEPFALLLHGPGSRWSYICAGPAETLTGDVATETDWRARLRSSASLQGIERPKDAPPFCGGWAGLLSYEFGRALLPHLGEIPHKGAWPDIALGFYDAFVVFDHETQTAEIWDWTGGRAESLIGRLGEFSPAEVNLPLSPMLPAARLSAVEYEGRIAKAVAYVRAGDCFQVNLSQRFDFELAAAAHPFDLFRKLTRASAAPYSAYFRLPDLALVSNSPEQFLEVRPGATGRYQVTTRPIKGTRPRGESLGQDVQLTEELVASEKDRAENLMIVDLMRNDLSRVSRPGSVKVPDLFAVESFANVHHLVSTVVAELRDDQDAINLIEAAFPGGSVTGAPKIRSMQIISELEDEARGPYCGSLVWMTPDGWMDSSILIRTAALQDSGAGSWTGHFRAGGGIVADSAPALERQETLDKASAMIRALTEHSSSGVRDVLFVGNERRSELSVSVRDRAFLLGDGCFETLRVADGKIDGSREHLALLRQSAGVLGIEGFPDDTALEDALNELAQGIVGEAALRITLSRGAGGRGADAAAAPAVTVLSLGGLAERRPYPPLRVITSTIRRNETSPLSRIKSTSYGDNLAARRAAVEAGADEALLLNLAGRPACLAMGNIFLRTASGMCVTPPASEGVREGYMRGQILAQLAADGIIVQVRPIEAEELRAPGASLFGVNSLWGMRPVQTLDGHALMVSSSVF